MVTKQQRWGTEGRQDIGPVHGVARIEMSVCVCVWVITKEQEKNSPKVARR